MPHEVHSSGVAIERRWIGRTMLLGVLGACVAVFATAMWALHERGDEEALLLIVLTVVLAGVALAKLVHTAVNPTPSASLGARKPARVSVEDGALDLKWLRAGRLTRARFDAGAIEEGWVEDLPSATSVVLRMHDRTVVSLTTPSCEAGAKLLRDLGVAADQQVLRVRLEAASQRSLLRGAGALLATIVVTIAITSTAVMLWVGGGKPFSAPAFALSLYAFYRILGWVMPPVAVVGTDAVVVRGLSRREAYPYSDVLWVRASASGVELGLQDGRTITLPTRRARLDEEASAPSAVLAERIRGAMASAARGASARAAAGALERNGRPWAEFCDHLKSLLGKKGGYRAATLEREDLLAVLEDNAARPAQRVAAVLALSASGPADDLHERLRVVLDTCADEDLREAIEEAAALELDERCYARVEARRAGAPSSTQSP